jgi:hypothetical protein
MMIRRPEGLFPVESAKAEMHGIGVAASETMGTADEMAVAEEIAVEEEIAAADDMAVAEETAVDEAVAEVTEEGEEAP